jgi:ribulose 1,5-bisphosphate synthetase/thiazole synthase
MTDKSRIEFVEDATGTGHESNVVAKPTYKVGADVDDALQLALIDTEVSWSEEEERKVVRKIDLVLLPVAS